MTWHAYVLNFQFDVCCLQSLQILSSQTKIMVKMRERLFPKRSTVFLVVDCQSLEYLLPLLTQGEKIITATA